MDLVRGELKHLVNLNAGFNSSESNNTAHIWFK